MYSGPRSLVARVDGEGMGRRRDGTDERVGSVDDHLHVGHHGPAKGRSPHALRIPDQSGAGHEPRPRLARGRDALLAHGHGLDDGAVAGVWLAAARRDDDALRRRARLAGVRSFVGPGRETQDYFARNLADARAFTGSFWRRTGAQT